MTFSAVILIGALVLLLAITCTDVCTGFVTDFLSLPLLALGIVHAFLSPPFSPLSPLIGFAFFALQRILGKEKWIGGADIIVAAALGFFFLDWRLEVLSLMIAYLCGSIVGTVLLLAHVKRKEDSIAFIPFLALGAIVAFVFGPSLLAHI